MLRPAAPVPQPLNPLSFPLCPILAVAPGYRGSPGRGAKFAALSTIAARAMWGSGSLPALRRRSPSPGLGLVPPCAAGPGHSTHPEQRWLRLWGQPQPRKS